MEEPEPFKLRDGTIVLIRPIRPSDAPKLQELLSRLSSESIFFRFLEYLKSLSDQQARDLATVDYQFRMALVAVLEKDGQEQIIAVARYSPVRTDQPDVAEVGIVVEDPYQNQGLGSYLLDKLTRYATEHGIRTFVGTINHQNRRILNFIRRSGLPTERRLEQGIWEIWVDLQQGSQPPHDSS